VRASASSSNSPQRNVIVSPPFDLARTVAPVWWARGRWPDVEWIDRTFYWVGWEAERLVWRSIKQVNQYTIEILGASDPAGDEPWASDVLGCDAVLPMFEDPVLMGLAASHAGLRPWSAGSFFAGVVSSIVGQSISVAAAATTQRRLFERFNEPLEIKGRQFWPPVRPEQLAASSVETIRGSGVTTKRAEALVAVGALFASHKVTEVASPASRRSSDVERLLAVPGIGPWTVRSALLWGVADDDSHPTGDVALLRAARRHYPEATGLKDLDRLSERWKPYRGWAARLLWLDLLGYDR
jgi:3-methyladenine DNA glycosylase/8-oxoguanine DNA glycosylase